MEIDIPLDFSKGKWSAFTKRLIPPKAGWLARMMFEKIPLMKRDQTLFASEKKEIIY